MTALMLPTTCMLFCLVALLACPSHEVYALQIASRSGAPVWAQASSLMTSGISVLEMQALPWIGSFLDGVPLRSRLNMDLKA